MLRSAAATQAGIEIRKAFQGSFGPFMSKFFLADGTQLGITTGPRSVNVEGPHAILRAISPRACHISIHVLKQQVLESTVAAEYPHHAVTTASTCTGHRELQYMRSTFLIDIPECIYA